MAKKNNNIGEVVATGFGVLGLIGLGALAAWGEQERLRENQKGCLKCAMPTPEIMQRSSLMAMGKLSDEQVKKFTYDYPHVRNTVAELKVGDIVMCSSINAVYMVTK